VYPPEPLPPALLDLKRIAPFFAKLRLAAAFLALAAPALAIDISSTTKLTISNETAVYNDRITGSVSTGSYLTPGTQAYDNLSTLYATKVDSVAWEAALDGRATSDPRYDARSFDLKRFYVKRQTDATTAIVGDFLASFSDYTLGKSLKGAEYVVKFGTGSQVTVVAGMDQPNWYAVWDNKAVSTVDRQVWGIRGQQTFLDDGSVGANFVWAKDERSALDTTDLAVDQRLTSIDWVLPRFYKLILSGESAYAFSQNDQPTYDPVSNSTTSVHSTLHGWAHKVRARWTHKRFKTQTDFERVSPEYETTVGAATPDLLRVKTDNTLTISGPWKWIVFRYTYFHNNLVNNSQNTVSTTRMPETGIKYEAPDWAPDLSVESKLRARDVTSSQTALVSRTHSLVNTVNDRFGPLSVEIDYELQKEDASDGSESLLHNIFGLGSTMLTKYKGWKFTEGLHWDLQRDRDQILNNTDQTSGIKANALAVSPWFADAGATYTRTLVLNATSPGNDRRTFLGALGYDFAGKPEHRLELSFRQNDNRFDTPGMDYKEMIWQLSLKDKF